MNAKNKFVIKICDDIELVKKMHEIIFPTDDWYENKTAVSWIIWCGGSPVGFCMLSVLDNQFGFLARAGVIKEFRGCGLQQRLIKVREQYLKKNGFTKVITYTKMSNITSSRNLQKCGYWLYLPEYEYADKDCLYWYKDLK